MVRMVVVVLLLMMMVLLLVMVLLVLMMRMMVVRMRLLLVVVWHSARRHVFQVLSGRHSRTHSTSATVSPASSCATATSTARHSHIVRLLRGRRLHGNATELLRHGNAADSARSVTPTATHNHSSPHASASACSPGLAAYSLLSHMLQLFRRLVARLHAIVAASFAASLSIPSNLPAQRRLSSPGPVPTLPVCCVRRPLDILALRTRHVRRLHALVAHHDVKLDVLAIAHGPHEFLRVVADDGGLVHEDVLLCVDAVDEPVAALHVEPLDDAGDLVH